MKSINNFIIEKLNKINSKTINIDNKPDDKFLLKVAHLIVDNILNSIDKKTKYNFWKYFNKVHNLYNTIEEIEKVSNKELFYNSIGKHVNMTEDEIKDFIKENSDELATIITYIEVPF